MIFIHPTRSLAKKLKISTKESSHVETKPPLLHTWFCNDFRFSRMDLALFVNSETYLPLVLKAAPYNNLIERFLPDLQAYLKELGYQNLIQNWDSNVVLTKTHDRSTLGVMTQFIKELEVEDYLGRLRLEDTQTMTSRLTSTLIGGPKYKTPLERLAEKARFQKEPPKTHLKLVPKNK